MLLWNRIIKGFLTFPVAATPSMATVKSVFTSSGAAGILTNDLVRIMENERVSQVFINHLEYHLHVFLTVLAYPVEV